MEKNLDFLTKEENEARNEFLNKFNLDILSKIDDTKLPFKIYGNIEHDSMAYNAEFILKEEFGRIGGCYESKIYPIKFSSKEGNIWKKGNNQIETEEAIQFSKNTIKYLIEVEKLILKKDMDNLFTYLNEQKDIFKFRFFHKYLCIVYPNLFLYWHSKEEFNKYKNILNLNDNKNIFVVEKYFWDKYKNNIEKLNMKQENDNLEKQIKENVVKVENNQNEQEVKEKDSVNENKNKDINQPLNQILYGPPGTGKTYNTVIKAMEIIDKNKIKYDANNNVTNYDELKKEFEKYKSKGKIEFITFHQSYSYEEFIEGIKPIIYEDNNYDDNNDKKENQNNDIKYEIKFGILKRICDNAKQIQSMQQNEAIDFTKTRIFKMSLGNAKTESDIFDYCIDNNCISLGWGKDIDFSQCNSKQDINTKTDGFGRIALNIFKLRIRKGDIILISNGNRNIRAIAQVEGDYEFNDTTSISENYGYMHYRKVKWLYNGENIPVTKVYNKNLSRRSIYAFYLNENENKENYDGTIKTEFINDLITGNINNKKEDNYILIIDEINRGNISKIFGELITLIEEDKRIGNPHELKLTLPYSQEEFGIPKNLYIIGTMNTSDRSIASVDIALRRRFKFIEMMPKYDESIVTNIFIKEGKNFIEIFKALNEKITLLLDRDHQIGHSYFMKDKINDDIYKLRDVWFDEILPLLNEYFYNDWEKLQALLGEASDKNDSFIVTNKTNLPFYNYDIEDKIYNFAKKEDMKEENFKLALSKIIEATKKKENNNEILETK